MNKLILTSAVLALISAPMAYASDNQTVVQDHYKTITKQIPQVETTCYEVEIPVYGSTGNNATTGDILTGAIIGGVIGNNIKGEKNGGAAGAVIGGLLGANSGNKKETIVGYRKENRCENKTTYSTQYNEVYSHSTVTFWDNGRKYSVRFQK